MSQAEEIKEVAVSAKLREERGMIGQGRSTLSVGADENFRSFDVVIIDLIMPEIDGYETTKRLR